MKNLLHSYTATQLQKISVKKLLLCFIMMSGFVYQKSTLAQSWNLNGNAANSNYFLGTTNNFPLQLRTNNIERFRIQPNGFIGIGVTNPLQRLDINGNLRVRGNVFVDQNVFQQGQFAADSVDAGLINATDIHANKITTDTLQTSSVSLSTNAQILGEAKFSNNASFSEKVSIGSQNPADKFEVHGGDARFFGNVKLNEKLIFGDGNLGLSFLQTNGTISKNHLLLGIEPPNFEVIGPMLNNNCGSTEYNYSYNAELDFPGAIKIFNTNYSEENLQTLSMFCDGANSIIESAGYNNSNNTSSSLLLNYYCGKDIHAVTGNNGGKFVIGKPNNTNLAFNVRGSSVFEGKMEIGSSNSNSPNQDEILFVDGESYFTGKISITNTLNAKKVIVCADGWCDYVFEEDYKLTPLLDVEKFIKENKHLPDVPSAKEIENQEVDIFEMQKIQMKKIEELTLYLIELKKENEEMKKVIRKFNLSKNQ